MAKKYILVEEDKPTIPKLTPDLEGFTRYVEAAGRFESRRALICFWNIIEAQKEKENET